MFSNPASGYGAAGSVVVLLFFLWLSAVIFILGAEMNAILQKRYDRKTIRDLIRHPDKTNPDTVQAERREARKAGMPDAEAVGAGPRTPAGEPAARRDVTNTEVRQSGAQITPEPRKSGLIVLAGLLGGVVVAAMVGRKERSG